MRIPNPGSKEALDQGCRCPVMDNNHGAGFPYPGVDGPAFYINDSCPIHGKSTPPAEEDVE